MNSSRMATTQSERTWPEHPGSKKMKKKNARHFVLGFRPGRDASTWRTENPCQKVCITSKANMKVHLPQTPQTIVVPAEMHPIEPLIAIDAAICRLFSQGTLPLVPPISTRSNLENWITVRVKSRASRHRSMKESSRTNRASFFIFQPGTWWNVALHQTDGSNWWIKLDQYVFNLPFDLSCAVSQPIWALKQVGGWSHTCHTTIIVGDMPMLRPSKWI